MVLIYLNRDILQGNWALKLSLKTHMKGKITTGSSIAKSLTFCTVHLQSIPEKFVPMSCQNSNRKNEIVFYHFINTIYILCIFLIFWLTFNDYNDDHWNNAFVKSKGKICTDHKIADLFKWNRLIKGALQVDCHLGT